MLCAVCRYDNFEGEDACANCGADLRTVDIPQPATSYQGALLGGHLDELAVGPPQSIDGQAPVDEAIRQMRDGGTDCLLVTERGGLIGIFTDRDAVLKVAGQRVGDRPIRELMTPDPVVLRRDDPIAVAIHKMAVGGFRHIPIVDDARLPTGVVSARDVFRHIAGQLGKA